MSKFKIGIIANGIEMIIEKIIVGIVLSFILGLIGIIHIFWAFGWKKGLDITIPEIDGKLLFSPPFIITLFIGLSLIGGMTVVLLKISEISPLGFEVIEFVNLGLGVMSVIFILRTIGDFKFMGMFKRIKGTKFAYWDTRVFSPLTLFLGLGCLFLLL